MFSFSSGGSASWTMGAVGGSSWEQTHGDDKMLLSLHISLDVSN